MDTAELTSALTGLLAKVLPYLIKGGETAAEEAGKQLGKEVWEAGKALWARLRAKLDRRPAAQEAAQDVADAPQDTDRQAALRVQLKKLLEADTDFAAWVEQWWKETAPRVSYHAEVHGGVSAQGSGSVAGGQVAVGRNVHGDLIVINVEADRIDPARLLQTITKRTPSVDLSDATDRYLRYLVDRYRYLDFRGMGISDRVPLRLPLLEMYVPLHVNQR